MSEHDAFNLADEAQDEISHEDTVGLTELMKQLEEAEAAVQKFEAALTKAKEWERKLRQEIIPNYFDALPNHTPFIGLSDGRKLEVVADFAAKITEKNKAAALQWLREHGAGALIKNEVKATFGKGDDEKALALKAELDAKGYIAEQNEAIHWRTLRKFVGEQIEANGELDEDLLGVYKYRTTKIS